MPQRPRIGTRYWQELEVSPVDVEDWKQRRKNPVLSLLRKIKNDVGWVFTLNNLFNTSYKDINALVTNIHKRRADIFDHIFLLIHLSDKSLNPEMVIDRSFELLSSEFQKEINANNISVRALVVALFYKDPAIIRELYYQSFIIDTTVKRFQLANNVQTRIDPLSIKDYKIRRFFATDIREFKRYRFRRFKVWRIDRTGGKLRIFFRVENLLRSSVKKLSSNQLVRMAGPRCIIFDSDGKRIGIISKAVSAERTATITALLLQNHYQERFQYVRYKPEFDLNRASSFFNKLARGKIKDAEIIEIRRRNVPLDGSPIIDLMSSGPPLTDALSQLSGKNLDMLGDLASVTSLKLRYRDNEYSLRFIIDKGKLTVHVGNTSINEKQKFTLQDFLLSHLG